MLLKSLLSLSPVLLGCALSLPGILSVGGSAPGTASREPATQKLATPRQGAGELGDGERGDAEIGLHRGEGQEGPGREPDFTGYFPDDLAGGAALDELWDTGQHREISTEAWAAAVRRGLRRAQTPVLALLRDLGNRGVWGKSPQNSAAVELMFHAADWKAGAPGGETQHYAVYFGLSVVEPKTERVLRALAQICLASDDPNTLGRIAWGASDHATTLIEYLQPALNGSDIALREKAEALVPILNGEDDAFAWSRRKARARAEALFKDRIPELIENLRVGDSEARKAALEMISAESLFLIIGDETIPAFAAAALDPSAQVRLGVARQAGRHWVWERSEEPAAAVDMLMALSRDEDPKVRYAAVYYGLSTVDAKREDVPQRLVEMLLEDSIDDLHGRILWGLRGKEREAAEALLVHIQGPDEERALEAFWLHERILRRPAPVRPGGLPEVSSLIGSWVWTLRFPGGEATQQSVTIERAEPNSEELVLLFDGERVPVAATTFQGLDLVFVFTGERDGTSYHSTARLRHGELLGSTYVADSGLLLAWSGQMR